MASRDLVVADATVHYRIGANVVKLCRLFRSSEGKCANLHSKGSLDIENLSGRGQFELLIVADEYDGAAGMLAQQGGIKFLFRVAIEMRVGFVEEQQPRLTDECARQECTLPLPAAEVADGAFGQGFQPE